MQGPTYQSSPRKGEKSETNDEGHWQSQVGWEKLKAERQNFNSSHDKTEKSLANC